MAGSGVSKENAVHIASAGVDALHLTSHKSARKMGCLKEWVIVTPPDPAKWFGIKTLFFLNRLLSFTAIVLVLYNG